MLNLKKPVGSRKSNTSSTQSTLYARGAGSRRVLGAPGKLTNARIINNVNTRTKNSPCTPTAPMSFPRPTTFFRLSRIVYTIRNLLNLLLVILVFENQVFAEDVPLANEALLADSNKNTAIKLSSEKQTDKVEVNPPVAPNVDLKDIAPAPVPVAVPAAVSATEEVTLEDVAIEQKKEEKQIIEQDLAHQKEQVSLEQSQFVILGSVVPPATATRLAWSPKVTIAGLTTPTPVLVINGKKPGPTLCMTAAIHGDELNGIEIIRRVMYDIDPKKLSGKIIGVPIVNINGFQRGSRYLSDRRDLNRAFPGDGTGSLASRIANSLFNEVIVHCNALIDLHTGSLRRTNLLQVRADMTHPDVVKFTEGFDETVVVHSPGEPGMLRQAAVNSGITAITLEAGESLRLQEDQVKQGVQSINSLLQRQDMYSRLFSWGESEPTYYRSKWIRSNTGGILFSNVALGGLAEKGEPLGTVTDPITNESMEIIAPVDGRIIGMAVNQVVMPGFAAYHLGIESPEDCLVEPEDPGSEIPESDSVNEKPGDLLCRTDSKSASLSKLRNRKAAAGE